MGRFKKINNHNISEQIIIPNDIIDNINIFSKVDNINNNLQNKNIIIDNDISIDNDITNDNDIISINDFTKKEKMLFDVLNNFFNHCTFDEVNIIIDIINGNHLISLRFLDWFVTRYCYLYKLSIPINNSYNKEIKSNVNISYKAQLKSFKKRYFDPFRRKKKFNYWFGDFKLNIMTTLGQLNFFRWSLSFDIIKYVEINFDEINNKMNHVNSYFKKNMIGLDSLTITSSDEYIQHFDKNTNYDTLSSVLSNNSNFNPINNDNIVEKIIPGNFNSLNNNETFNSTKIKSSTNLFKKSQPTYKYPQVTRNICIEF